MARTSVVAGGSGLVGGLLLAELLRSPEYSRVTALVRRLLPLEHPKLSQVIVDFDAVVNFARHAREAGAKRFLLVSSAGADARSRFLYPRVKGEAEEAVARLPFNEVHLFRPSFLIGNRAESRPLERALLAVLSPLRTLFLGPLRRYRPIEAAEVAAAMVRAALRGGTGVNVFENESIAGATH